MKPDCLTLTKITFLLPTENKNKTTILNKTQAVLEQMKIITEIIDRKMVGRGDRNAKV